MPDNELHRTLAKIADAVKQNQRLISFRLRLDIDRPQVRIFVCTIEAVIVLQSCPPRRTIPPLFLISLVGFRHA